MPGLLRTRRHSALKVYHHAQEICGCFTAYSDGYLATGGAKGEPGKYLERHSRGRGRITKATRTLWLVALRQYNHHAIAKSLENLNKSERCRTNDAWKCEQSRTPVSTANDTSRLFLAGPLHNPQQGPHRDARRTFRSIRLGVVTPGSSGNVEMRP